MSFKIGIFVADFSLLNRAKQSKKLDKHLMGATLVFGIHTLPFFSLKIPFLSFEFLKYLSTNAFYGAQNGMLVIMRWIQSVSIDMLTGPIRS